MSRKVIDLTIDMEGRDKGKKFRLSEMSAMRAEKWAAKALLALLGSGLEIPDDIANSGMAGVAAIGPKLLAGGMAFESVEPLLDEMLTCIEIVEPKISRPLFETDVEEVATLLFLRSEVLKLHTGFSLAERLSASQAPPKSPASSNTGTSRRQ